MAREANDMTLTKPAGCAAQAIGAPFTLVGFLSTFGAIAQPDQLVWTVPCLALGLLLLYIGRQTGK
jgi:hypothetical protein